MSGDRRTLTAAPPVHRYHYLLLAFGLSTLLAAALVPQYAFLALLGTLAAIVGVAAGPLVNRSQDRLTWRLMVVAGIIAVGAAVWREAVPDTSTLLGLTPAVLPLVGYGFFGAALVLMVRRRRGSARSGGIADGALVAVGMWLLAWAFIIEPALQSTTAPTITIVLDVLYPTVSTFLFLLVALLAATGLTAVPAFRFLLGGMGLLLAADVVYALHSVSLYTGIPLSAADGMYSLSYLLIGMASLHPSMRLLAMEATVKVKPLGMARLVSTTAALGLPVAILLGGPHSATTIWMTAVSFLLMLALVLWRMTQAVASYSSAEQRMAYKAAHDELTGLPNRSRIAELLTGYNADLAPVSAVFMDLDRFKYVNDTFGHAAGDSLLVAVSGRLSSLVRPSDVVARFGGDEFMVLLPGTLEDDAVEVASRIRVAMQKPFDLPFGKVASTASVGVAYSDGALSGDDLIRQADTALYEAKDRGRDQVAFYDEELAARSMRRLSLEKDLHGALERSEFTLHYQPVVLPECGRIVGFEALLRWNHPTLPAWEVSPDKFIPIAEESGIIVPLGAWVLDQACAQLAAWRKLSGHSELTMAVNVSARQFVDTAFVELVASTLVHHQLPARALDLEITESIFLDGGDAEGVFTRLRTLGVSLSIDDFGQGYSSLSYLRTFPVDHLKIDRTYVDRMCVSEKDGALVEAVVAMSKALKMKVIAEGVETAEQAAALAALGCDYAQGYLFDKPLPAAEATERLTQPRLQVVSDRSA